MRWPDARDAVVPWRPVHADGDSPRHLGV